MARHSILSHISFAVFVYILSLAYTNTVSFTYAQSFSPRAFYGPVSGYVDGGALFIQGGRTSDERPTSQSFSLDLSTSWNVNTPAFKQLPGGVVDSRHAGTLLGDNVTMLVISDTAFYTYHTQTGETKRALTTDRITGNNKQGLKVVTNPRTGDVYVVGGFWSNTDKVGAIVRFFFSPLSQSSVDGGSSMPLGLQNVGGFAAAWSNHINGILVFGGLTDNTTTTHADLHRYNAASNSWTLVTTSGPGPVARYGSCMVQYKNTIIVFGGKIYSGYALNDVFTLNLDSWTWTRGQDAPVDDSRSEAACAISGDLLVAVGGYAAAESVVPNSKLVSIYNVTANAWQTSFSYSKPGSDTVTPPTPTPIPPKPESSSNIGAIVGGVVGGVVVLCAILFFVFKKRSNNNNNGKSENSQVQGGNVGAGGQPNSEYKYIPAESTPQGYVAQSYPMIQQGQTQPVVTSSDPVYAPLYQTQYPTSQGHSPPTTPYQNHHIYQPPYQPPYQQQQQPYASEHHYTPQVYSPPPQAIATTTPVHEQQLQQQESEQERALALQIEQKIAQLQQLKGNRDSETIPSNNNNITRNPQTTALDNNIQNNNVRQPQGLPHP
ncbi:F-box only protein 42 [Podila humilis]|nr:F-box only protein 42 [Podila humilis]